MMDLSLKDATPFWGRVVEKLGRTGPSEPTAAAVLPLVAEAARSCPLCFILLELEWYTMSSLPLALTQDAEVRRHLAVEAPPCNHHAWYLCRLGTPGDLAAFAAAWLEPMIQAEEYRPGLRSAGGLDPRLRRPRGTEGCPLCSLLRAQTRELCGVLVALLELPAAPDPVSVLRLCLPHFAAALEAASGALARQRLVRAEAQGMGVVLAELAEARRQYAARARQPGPLRDVHVRGIQMCVGMPGLIRWDPGC